MIPTYIHMYIHAETPERKPCTYCGVREDSMHRNRVFSTVALDLKVMFGLDLLHDFSK